MDRIERLAFLSVGRGCGFSMFAVVLIVIALSTNFALAMLVGGQLCLLGCLVLLLRARLAHRWPHERTEVWMMLDAGDRPPKPVAQRIVATALRGAYLVFAREAATLAAGMSALSLMLRLAD
ncbi:MAG: hypothetical protein R3D27_13250 [Hyphomicrobiaceae bacterium]